ncbi:MAG: nucleotide exchange factor GrpE [Litorimonas sp.]
MSGENGMDEWDALQAQIDAGGADKMKDGKMERKPTEAELRKAADAFLKQHKDVVSDEDGDAPYPESVMEDGEVVADGTGSAADAARIAELETELATLKDQALRVRAEAENIRKRSEREVQNAKLYGVEKFAGDVLSVYDNLSRALHTIDGQAREELGENARNLVSGIELTEKDLTAALGRHNIKPVDGVGSKFDPNVHQAVANIPHPEIEKGHVAAVMQQGFTIGDRTLRAAMVAVSTGKG